MHIAIVHARQRSLCEYKLFAYLSFAMTQSAFLIGMLFIVYGLYQRRFDSARVRGPHRRLGRGTSAPDSADLRPLLQ